jgi:hypothetical protein
MSGITFAEINRLTLFNLGIFDTACPACGPGRTSPANKTRKVLRVYRKEPGVAAYKCQRCGIEGWAREDASQARDFVAAKPAKLSTMNDGEEQARRQHAKSLALWRRRGELVRPAAVLDGNFWRVTKIDFGDEEGTR